MQGKQTGEFIRALSVALRLLFYFFIAMLYATNWQILLPLVISIITCGKQRQLWDMRLYLSDQKKTNEKIKVERHQWVKGYENLRGSNIHKTFFSKKSVKYFFKINKVGGYFCFSLTWRHISWFTMKIAQFLK